MQRGRQAAILVSVLLMAALAATGGALAKPKAGSAPVSQGPILDPRTGSYFELRIDNKTPMPGGGYGQATWSAAVRRAAARSYKGRRGRLAVVKDIETLEFIREKFRINQEVWIGLRFFCDYRKLMWVTGEIHPLSENGLWHPKWFRNNYERCTVSGRGSMPVYLTRESAGGVYWQATGPSKFFVSYLVEYPAPAAARDRTADQSSSSPNPSDTQPFSQ